MTWRGKWLRQQQPQPQPPRAVRLLSADSQMILPPELPARSSRSRACEANTSEGTVLPNMIFGWSSVLAGFLSGMLLGTGFHREGFLGGYGSLRRRMLRLGHIALVALGGLNVLFALSAGQLRLPPAALDLASWAWIFGGLAMPLCCLLMAWRPAARMLFVLPILSLSLAAGLVIWGLART